MRPLIVNTILVLVYLMGGFCWLTLDLDSPFLQQNNLWRLFGVVVMFAFVIAFTRLKRADTGKSILRYNGLYVPFYIL